MAPRRADLGELVERFAPTDDVTRLLVEGDRLVEGGLGGVLVAAFAEQATSDSLGPAGDPHVPGGAGIGDGLFEAGPGAVADRRPRGEPRRGTRGERRPIGAARTPGPVGGLAQRLERAVEVGLFVADAAQDPDGQTLEGSGLIGCSGHRVLSVAASTAPARSPRCSRIQPSTNRPTMRANAWSACRASAIPFSADAAASSSCPPAGGGHAGDDAGAPEKATVGAFFGRGDGLVEQPAGLVRVGLDEPGDRKERVEPADPPQVSGGVGQSGGALDVGPGRLGTDGESAAMTPRYPRARPSCRSSPAVRASMSASLARPGTSDQFPSQVSR